MSEDDTLAEARRHVLKEASDQSFRLRVVKEEAAREIARMCDIRRKPHDPAAFIDVAIQLLCYPPELGFVIAQEFTEFAPMLGFQPYGTILVAVGHVDSLFSGMLFRMAHLRENPQLGLILESKAERLARAAKLLITGLLLSTGSAGDARAMFVNISADPSIKELMRRELTNSGLGFVVDQKTTQVNVTFQGTGFQALGYGLLTIILGLLVIPYAWGAVAQGRWFVRNLSFSDRTEASSGGRGGEIWGTFAFSMITGALAMIISIISDSPLFSRCGPTAHLDIKMVCGNRQRIVDFFGVSDVTSCESYSRIV